MSRASTFSARLPAALEPNRLARALEARRAAGLPLFDLTESNPARAGLSPPDEQVLAALSRPGALAHEPDPKGLRAAREAVSGYYAESRGARVDPEQLVLTASTSEAYALLFKLLCDPGDCVLVPAPSYPLFGMLSALESVEARSYPLRWDGAWHLDLPALEQLASAPGAAPRARAVLVVSPGNPTGAYLSREEHARLAALCAARGLALIADEVFAEAWLASQPSPRALPTAAVEAGALTFTLSGLSKLCALPQLKLGWCAVTGPSPLVREALERLELIADTYLSVAAPVQHALPALLPLRHDVQARLRVRCLRNRQALLAARPPDARWDLLPAEAGWSALLRIPDHPGEEETALALLARGVLVQPGYFYDFPRGSFLVLSLLAREEEFAAALAPLVEVLRGS